MYPIDFRQGSLCLVIIAALLLVPRTGLAQWTNVTSSPLDIGGTSNGVAWADYDNDGDLDLYVCNALAANVLLRNEGTGIFTDVTSGALGDAGPGQGVAWGDYDNDGLVDLYFANNGTANKLLRNTGGAFADVVIGAGSTDNDWGVAWGDYDNDGDLDLYVTSQVQPNKLLRYDAGMFADVTVAPLNTSNTRGAAWGDYDNDGDLDLYLARSLSNQLLRNDGGTFTDVTSGVLGDNGNCLSVAWADFDNDGDLDLYLANTTANKLLRNQGGGTFIDVTFGPTGDASNTAGIAWADYDQDGDLDLYLVNTTANKLLRNDGGNLFSDVTVAPLDDANNGTSAAWGDYDGDGDLDIYLTNNGAANQLFRNDNASGNHWLHVDLEGVTSNASGIGARVRVVAGGTSQRRDVSGGDGGYSQGSLTAEFGLGANATVDTLEIRWPSGFVHTLAPLHAGVDRVYTIPEDQTIWWEDATSGPLGDAGSAGGVAWGDYDNDGDLDIYLVKASANRLFRNDGAGAFVDATAGPLGDTGNGSSAAWGDYDGDGDLDLYVANYGANKLLRNDGGGVFADATSPPLDEPSASRGGVWGDYDNDGDLDLYVPSINPNKLFRNEGSGVFSDATSGPLQGDYVTVATAWADYDNDGDLDLYLANSNQENKLLRNDGSGVFTDVTSGALGNTDTAADIAWGDYDNDGDLDLYLVNHLPDPNKLFRNDGGDVFTDVTVGPLIDEGWTVSATWGDYDNDGDLDLYMTGSAGSEENKLLRNDGGDVFVNVATGDLSTASGEAIWGDYDNDGDLDLYTIRWASPNQLLRNDNYTGNHWLHVHLAGAISNTPGIGAHVRIVAGGVTQMREISGGSGVIQNSLAAEFGLGATTTVDLVEVSWPSGIVSQLYNVAVDQAIWITEATPAAITSIADTPNDQGRRVRIEWARSSLDSPASAIPITEYAIFREYDPGLLSSERTVDTSQPSRHPALQFLPPGWDFVMTVPAFGEATYSTNVATMADSTVAEGIYYSKFLVRAMTGTPSVFLDSPPDSGYSLDNLSPAVPQSLLAAYNTGSGNTLTWDPVADEDLQHYRTYRSTNPAFIPTAGDLVGATTDTGWSDPDFDGGNVHYKITAVDFSGNESDPAAPETATALGTDIVPQRFALYQNVPNPFNPTTLIRYDVPAGGGLVSLRIFDVSGGLVRTLVDKPESAGRKRIQWDGKNDAGTRVSTGLYFYRLTAPGTQATRKMLLLK